MNTLNFKPKLTALAIILVSNIACTSTPAFAADKMDAKQVETVNRDIKIMSNILSTTLKDKIGQRAGDVTGRFLANQGLMFEISSGNRFFTTNFFSHAPRVAGLPPAPEMPPAPPIPAGPNKRVVVVKDGEVVTDNIIGEDVDVEVEMDGIEELEERIEEVMELRVAADGTERVIEWSNDGINQFEMLIDTNDIIRQAMPGATSEEQQALRKKHRELRQKQRELERSANKIERKTRQIERQMRDAELAGELGDKKTKDKLSALEKQMKQLSTQLSSVNSELLGHRKLVEEQVQKAKKEARERAQKLTKQYADTISEVVCDFAGGLRSLDDDQYMTFYVNDVSKMYYVFSNKDIKRCQAGKMSYRELLSKATKYSL